MDAREPTADRPSYEELERRVAELEAEVAKLALDGLVHPTAL